MPQRAIIEGLAPSRKALVLPLNFDTFYPGLPMYEALVGDLRALPKVDVFGFAFPFGVVPERVLVEAPEVLAVARTSPERAGYREMAVRTRAWLDDGARIYDPIVLLNHGPSMPVWTRAVSGSPLASRVSIVNVHRRTGLGGTLVRNRLDKVLR